jgi:enamine deaminase RidA (YjgF/YER057c/UK114 family)
MPSLEPDRRQFLQAAVATAALAQSKLSLGAANDELPYGIVDVIDSDPQTGTSRAVVVGNVPLVHTEQFGTKELPAGIAKPKLDDPQKIAEHLASSIAELTAVLQVAGSSLAQVVKFNFVLSHPRGQTVVFDWLKATYAGRYRPAVSFVVNSIPESHFDHLVKVDAVATRRDAVAPGNVVSYDAAAVLPPLHKLYISGDAVTEPLMTSVAGTLDSLEQTLKHVGLDWSHAVQLKVFLQPIILASDVRREMATYFGTRPMPVTVFVEWKSAATVPIEIELIAAAMPELGNRERIAVEYLTPPHKKSSPVFCRAVRVNSDRTIYVSGLYGEPSDAAGQVRDILTTLQKTVERAGGDMRHLVKATYYVSDAAASKALNEIRPEFYDPARPPAASKAMVVGTGRAEKAITVDMIAVPK